MECKLQAANDRLPTFPGLPCWTECTADIMASAATSVIRWSPSTTELGFRLALEPADRTISSSTALSGVTRQSRHHLHRLLHAYGQGAWVEMLGAHHRALHSRGHQVRPQHGGRLACAAACCGHCLICRKQNADPGLCRRRTLAPLDTATGAEA